MSYLTHIFLELKMDRNDCFWYSSREQLGFSSGIYLDKSLAVKIVKWLCKKYNIKELP